VERERSERGTGGWESRIMYGRPRVVALQGLNKVCVSALAGLPCLSPACRQAGQTGTWRYVLPPVPLRSTDGRRVYRRHFCARLVSKPLCPPRYEPK